MGRPKTALGWTLFIVTVTWFGAAVLLLKVGWLWWKESWERRALGDVGTPDDRPRYRGLYPGRGRTPRSP